MDPGYSFTDTPSPADRPFPMAVGEYATGDASLFWDVEDSSILRGLHPHSIFQNLRSAIEKRGYCGYVSIRAYVDENTLPKELITKFDLAGIQITLVPSGNRYSRVRQILLDMFYWAMKRSVIDEDTLSADVSPSTLVVLSKNIEDDSLFSYVHFRAFKRFFNVVISTRESLMGHTGSSETKIITLPPKDQNVFIISGPRGAGRDAVIQRFREVYKDLHFVATTTCSEEMALDEDYCFVERHVFLGMVDKGELVRFNVEKGISRQEIQESMAKGEYIVLKADDVLEASYLMTSFPSAVFIYLAADSDISTPVESEELLVNLARVEAWHLDFNHVVVQAGGKLDDAVKSLGSIVDAVRSSF